MDLRAVLNNEDKDDVHHATSTISSNKRQPPPPLTTSRSTSYYAPSPHSNTFDSPQRLHVAHSPGSYPPPSAHSYTSTPHSAVHSQNYQSPFQRNVALPSPSARSGSLSNSHFPIGQRPSSHHSTLHRSSTSPPEQILPYSGSPHLSRTTQTSTALSSQPSLPPHTPLGPPPPIIRHDSTQSSHAFYDSPAPPYHRHRSSSGASYISPSGPTRASGSIPSVSAAPPEAHTRRGSVQSQTTQRAREDSVSVSPRTVVPNLHRPACQANIDPTRQTPGIMARPPLENGISPSPDIVRPQHRISAPGLLRDTFVQDMHGTKRPAEVENIRSESLHKRTKMMKTPPVWAQMKRGFKPMKLTAYLRPHEKSARQSRSPQPCPVPQDMSPRPIASANTIHDKTYERSFRNVIPVEDLTRRVADFIFAHIHELSSRFPLEIEAKVGRIIDRHSRERVRLPLLSETILDTTHYDVSFESTMTETNHKGMNDFLNESLLKSREPPPLDQPRIPIQYIHHREADAFYELTQKEAEKLPPAFREFLSQHARSRGPHRIRITRNLQTGDVLAKIIKARISDLNVYCPNSSFDWRISINVEFPWEGEPEELEEQAANSGKPRERSRNKDRLSYSHQFCQIDLTQVKAGVQAGGKYDSISHELEVEFDVNTAQQQSELARSRQPNHYSDYIKVFLDNVRTLARYMT